MVRCVPHGALLVVAVLANADTTRSTSNGVNVEGVSTVSHATFAWLNPTLRIGARRPLQDQDLPRLRRGSAYATETFEREWDAVHAVGGTDRPNAVALALFRSIRREFAVSGVVKLISDTCQLIAPLLLRSIISKLEAGATLRDGSKVILWLFSLSVLQTFTLRHYFAQLFGTGLKLKAAIVGATYHKLLRLAPAARLGISTGELTNLMGPDAQRVADLVPYLHALWFAPLQLVGGLLLLYREVGIALLPGVAVVVAMLLANKLIAAATYQSQKTLLSSRDSRIRRVRELLTSIKIIKLHAWEEAFADRVGAARRDELDSSAQIVRLRSLLSAVFSATPTLVAVALLGMHVLMGRQLTLGSTMTVLSAVNLLRSPLLFLPLVLQSAQEARTSLSRMQAFLNAAEARPVTPGPLNRVGVYFSSADVVWPYAQQPRTNPTATDTSIGALPKADRWILRGVDFEAKSGELVAIVGAVGTGKTAVLSALVGGSQLAKGNVHLRGAVAYCAQRPFILSASVRENILFGQPYNPERYSQVLEACALTSDILEMAAGDLTEIGERGASLSGGQRSRIALARAAYSNAQVVLLDDPLAAVDGVVARHLMSSCIGANGFMRDRLVIMTTNALDMLQEAQHIIVLSDGEVAEQGSFTSLMANERIFFKLHALQKQTSNVDEIHDGATEQESDLAVLSANAHDQPKEAVTTTTAPVSWSEYAMSIWSSNKPAASSANASDEPTTEAVTTTTSAPVSWSEFAMSMLSSRKPSISDSSLDTTSGTGHTIDGRTSSNENCAKDEADSVDESPHLDNEWTHTAEPQPDVTVHSSSANQPPTEGMAIQSDEERQVGRVSSSVLAAWLAAAGGVRAAPRMLIPLLMSEMLTVGSSWWLTRWASMQSSLNFQGNAPYLLVYTAWALAAAFMTVVRSRTILTLGLRAGSVMHDGLMHTLLRAPLAFFDTTPIGRLLARFAREMQTVDQQLPSALQSYGSTLFAVLSALFVVCTSSPSFLIAVVPLALAYRAISAFYLASSRELKRIESMSRAPLLTHVSETIDGLESIRAFGVQPRFSRSAEDRLDSNYRASLISAMANCWLGLRLELLGATLAAIAAALAFVNNRPATLMATAAATATATADATAAVFGPLTEAAAQASAAAADAARAAARGAARLGRAALSVSLAMQITQALNWSVRQACELEANLVAVERMHSFSDLSPEPGYELHHELATTPASAVDSGSPDAHRDEAWADRSGRGGIHKAIGQIELNSVGLRYRSGLPLALDGVSIVIQPAEKVGVVGRTGSGKSSLLMALTRLVAPPLRTGQIKLDGEDITDLPLLAYRSAISVIPQEATLFEGSIRFNLDPLGLHPPEHLWRALERVHLAHAIGTLDDAVLEDGANLSAGQRQLICIARALLAKPVVLIMDEATSAVDAETDALIQRTVRSEFRDVTVLTIAHRLNTVLDADKVLVLDAGRAVEYGPPRELMKQHQGFFREMVGAADEPELPRAP